MLKQLTATAAVVTCCLGNPAQAYSIDASHALLLDSVRSMGIRVYINPEQCSKGMQGFYSGLTMGLCSKNSPNRADYLDTIRHETWHIAQRCEAMVHPSKAGKHGLAVISDKAAQIGLKRFGSVVSAYPLQHWGTEAEAWGAAYHLSADEIHTVLKKTCSFAF